MVLVFTKSYRKTQTQAVRRNYSQCKVLELRKLITTHKRKITV